MKALAIVISIVLLLVCLVLSVIVLMQESDGNGLSGAISGSSNTYMSKNKSRTLSGKLRLITKISGAAYLVLSLVLYFVIA